MTIGKNYQNAMHAQYLKNHHGNHGDNARAQSAELEISRACKERQLDRAETAVEAESNTWAKTTKSKNKANGSRKTKNCTKQ